MIQAVFSATVVLEDAMKDLFVRANVLIARCMPYMAIAGILLVLFVAEPFFNFDVRLLGVSYTAPVVYGTLVLYGVGILYAFCICTILKIHEVRRLHADVTSLTVLDCVLQAVLWGIMTIKNEFFDEKQYRWSYRVESAWQFVLWGRISPLSIGN